MVNHPLNRYVTERFLEFRNAELEARARKHAALVAAGINPRRSVRNGFAATLRRLADRLETDAGQRSSSIPCQCDFARDA